MPPPRTFLPSTGWRGSFLLVVFATALACALHVRADEPKEPTVPTAKEPAADEPKEAAPANPAENRFRELRNLYRENPAKAVEGFRSFLVTFADSDWADDAQYWLAMSLEKAKTERREILAAYQTLLEKYPKSSYHDDAFFAIAELWRRQGERPEDCQQAIKAYLNFIDNCPQSERLGEAKLKVGELYMALKKYDQAVGFFRRVADEHPASPFTGRAQMHLASIYLRTQKPDDALAIYAKLLEQDIPDRQRLTVRLGMVDCYLSRKDGLEKALETCRETREEANRRKGLEDYADYATREKMASYYLAQKKYKEAESEYETYIARFAKSVGVWQARLNIGMIRLAAGKPPEAREMFQAITSTHAVGMKEPPSYLYRAMYYEAFTYELEKNSGEAKRLYQKLIDAYPRTPEGRRAREQLQKLEKESEKPPQPEKKG